MPLNEVLKNAGINVAGNMAINALMDVALPNYVDNLGKNKLEAAEKEAAEYAENLGKATPFDLSDENIDALIPSLKGADQVVDAEVDIPSLIKQQEDAVQNIDSLAKQIPQNDVDNILTKVYDESVNNVDSTLRGNENGTAVNRTGNQGNIRPEEFEPSGSEIGRSVDSARTYTTEDGRTLNLRNVVDESFSKKMDDAGINNFGLIDTSGNTNSFSKQLAEAKAANPNGRMVSYKAPEDLTDAKLYTDSANTCGVAVEPSGDIVAVHKHPSNKQKGAVDDMLITARANGGDRLDCYGSGLVAKYEKDGFTPVARVEWNEKFKPDDWGDNPPETVFVMMKDNRSNEQVLEDIKNGTFKVSTTDELNALPLYTKAKFSDNAYDEAIKYRDSLIDGAPKQGAFFDGENIPKGTTSAMAESTGIDNSARASVDVPTDSSKLSSPSGADTVDNPDMRQRGYDKTYQSGRTNIQEGLKTEPEMYKARHKLFKLFYAFKKCDNICKGYVTIQSKSLLAFAKSQ